MPKLLLRPLGAAIAAALLAACTVGPDAVRPQLATDAQFVRASTDASATATANAPTPAADAAFWTRLDDAQLTALVAKTLVANHDLHSALANFDAANALLRGARFDQLPTVTAQASGRDARLSADQAPGVARADRDGRDYDAGARLGWELDLFGRVRRSVEARRAEAGALHADLQALQVSLVADTVDTYLTLRGLQLRLQVAQENARSQAATLALVERGLAAGRGNDFDLARARAQLESTQARVPALEADIAVSEHRLAVLTGQTPGALVDSLDPPRALPALPSAPAPGTPAELLRRRPDIAAAEFRLQAASAQVGVATADLFPRFTLSGLIGSQAGTRGALFERDSETRLVALGIDWSFLDVGRVRARIAAAKANAAGDLARYQQTVLRALEDTENALVRYDRAQREDAALTRAADDSARAAQLARTRYEAGAGTLLEVLDAERSNLQAQDGLAQSRTRSLTAWVGLYRALAGGWPAAAPDREAIADATR